MEIEQKPEKKPFPVITKQVAALINGVHTEIVLSAFIDRFFIAISQTGKFGTIIEAYKDQEASGFDPNSQLGVSEQGGSYTVKILLGKRDDNLLLIYARQIIQIIAASPKSAGRPLVLAIALKDSQKSTFSEILELIRNNPIW